MEGCLDRQMDGGSNGWREGQMGVQTDGGMDGRMGVQTEGWMEGCSDAVVLLFSAVHRRRGAPDSLVPEVRGCFQFTM